MFLITLLLGVYSLLILCQEHKASLHLIFTTFEISKLPLLLLHFTENWDTERLSNLPKVTANKWQSSDLNPNLIPQPTPLNFILIFGKATTLFTKAKCYM